jgi:hypothetical protein
MASMLCKIMGVVFIAIAIWGFVTGDMVLMFQVNMAHNIVHLLTGVAALGCGFAGEKVAKMFSITFGAVYGLVAVLGLLNVEFVVTLLHLNAADNWLHVAVAVVFLGVGLMSKGVPGRA